jgi:hypothetical protein
MTEWSINQAARDFVFSGRSRLLKAPEVDRIELEAFLIIH